MPAATLASIFTACVFAKPVDAGYLPLVGEIAIPGFGPAKPLELLERG